MTGRSTLRPSAVGRLILTTVAAGTLSVAWTVPAAAGPPIGGCPTPEWELRASPSGGVSGAPGVDLNGDGMSCWLEAPEGSGLFVIMDNVVKPR
jgi:hypothetical protein